MEETQQSHPVEQLQWTTQWITSSHLPENASQQMTVHSQDSHSNKSDRLKKSKVQGNRLTRFSHHSNTDFTSDQKSLSRDLHTYWNNRETLSTNLKMDTNTDINRMTTIQHLMSKHCYGSISNRSTQPEENTAQEKYLTRLPGYNNTDQLCDRESRPTDLPESWPHKELLHNRPVLINQGYQIIPTTHKEVYLLSRPLKAMAHRYQHTEKEAHLLSGPSEFQLPDASEAQELRSPTQVQQSRQEYNQLTENPKAKFHITYIPNEEKNYVERRSVNKIPSALVHLTKSDTSSVSDSMFSEGRDEIAEDASAPAEDIPVPAPAEIIPAPAPPAPPLETVEK